MEELINGSCTVAREQIQLEFTQSPLSTGLRVVILSRFLDCNVCEVDETVPHFGKGGGVPSRREPRKARAMEIDRERRVRSDEDVDAIGYSGK